MISQKFGKISLGCQKFFTTTRVFFLTVGRNNYGNKIPITYNQTISRVIFWFSNLSTISATKLGNISWVWIDAYIWIRLHKRFIVFIPQILCVASFQGTFPAWKSYIMQQNFIILYFFLIWFFSLFSLWFLSCFVIRFYTFVSLKFMFSKKVTKNYEIFTVGLMFT